jgi:CBS domain-containing protein
MFMEGRAMLKASEIMTHIPQTVTPTQTVADAVEIMKSEDCGVVPVVSPEDNCSLVGIITDRDIALRACSEGRGGASMPIVEAMSTNLFVVAPEDPLPRIRQIMETAGVRRVPVVDQNRLVGIISLKDLADNAGSSELGRIDDAILSQDPNN